MRFSIIGTGALGSYYGACLLRAGHEVHFLARSDYDVLKKSGLQVSSPTGDMHFPQLSVVDKAADLPASDFILLATKSTANNNLSEQLAIPWCNQANIVVLQNGLGVESDVANAIKHKKIIGGLCFLCSNRIAAGQIAHLDYGMISFGRYSDNYQTAAADDDLHSLAGAFTEAGIQITLEPDLLTARWKKLVWNVPFNGLSVILGATTDVMITDPAIRPLVDGLMQEVQSGARALGRTIDDSFLQQMVTNTEKMRPYKTSMQLDYDGKRPMEVEHLFGNPLRMARAVGCELKQLETIYHQLCYINSTF